MFRRNLFLLLSVFLLLQFHVFPASAARIKDIASFMGDRPNQLIGYGLIVGLNGTGDNNKTQFTVNTLANLLDNMGIHVNPDQVKVKNVAAVMATAKLPSFVRKGSRVDVQVSSIGDAKSLEGGTLLMTPLQGPDGKTYAVAQGPISVGGFSVSGASGSGVQKNHPTVGFVSGGALVEQEVPVPYGNLQQLDLVLSNPDFSTANKVSKRVNETLGDSVAQAMDAATIKVQVPESYQQNIVGLISRVESIEVQPDEVAKIVVNERTGTIVIGENVRISPVAVAHGNLTVQISETPSVSQPQPFGKGQTVVVPQSEVNVEEEKGHISIVGGGVTIGQVVKGLNAIGATPRDLINILQAIRAAGAMQAELEFI
ncbi:flagellar basal body P-ring protein FlgI [Desulforhabdus amnigena]|uniref:Flagellar P-ring protein n=1 Tax=Desulforhabdus amnigena TaxID=40218 RepID=A0A9W6FTL2_9BACT|nr:flagellar basal body P-ring protein FlgI [Desulforhabdus amnigena]GLI33561.1 flagellar P-ring protein [Desulforhabdus amnigena]